jgi:hypothetical protein
MASALRKEPGPLSFIFVTTMVAGNALLTPTNPWLAPGEATAPTAATTAEMKNNEQERRRNRGDLNPAFCLFMI